MPPIASDPATAPAGRSAQATRIELPRAMAGLTDAFAGIETREPRRYTYANARMYAQRTPPRFTPTLSLAAFPPRATRMRGRR